MHGSTNGRHNFSRILALDLGKFNSVLCDRDPLPDAVAARSSSVSPRLRRGSAAKHRRKCNGWPDLE